MMENDSIITKEKAKIYELFSNIFAKEPEIELLRLFQQKDNEALFRSYGIDILSDIKHLSTEQQAELLAAEYARLFLLPGRPILLQESLQRGEGRLWGNSTVEVNNLYKKFGFELEDGFKNTPDHLSAELAFLAELSKIESEYASKGLMESAKGVLEVKKHFLKDHLLLWFFDFKDAVFKNANFLYYKEIARFLEMILNPKFALEIKKFHNHASFL